MIRASLMDRLLARFRSLLQRSEAQYVEGLQALDGTKTGWQDAERAFRFFKYAANRGHLKAMVKFGECHEHGIGCKVDYWQAGLSYISAAEGGSADGIGHLADCLRFGIGIEPDIKEAIKYYQDAADKNDPEAQSGLGLCYEDGVGVVKDPIEAVRWYRRSAGNGSAEGQFHLGRCYLSGIGVETDHVQAVHWYSLAAGQGKDAIDHLLRIQTHPEIAAAMCHLGLCYEMGLGVKKDDAQAEYWYCEAAHRQNTDACRKYAGLLKAGSDDPDNRETSEIWLQRAQTFSGKTGKAIAEIPAVSPS